MTPTAPDLTVEPRPMDLSVCVPTDADLYERGIATLLASCGRYAHGSRGTAVHHLARVTTAVFPSEPERSAYNNALLERDLVAAERAAAIASMEAVYKNGGVTGFAAAPGK